MSSINDFLGGLRPHDPNEPNGKLIFNRRLGEKEIKRFEKNNVFQDLARHGIQIEIDGNRILVVNDPVAFSKLPQAKSLAPDVAAYLKLPSQGFQDSAVAGAKAKSQVHSERETKAEANRERETKGAGDKGESETEISAAEIQRREQAKETERFRIALVDRFIKGTPGFLNRLSKIGINREIPDERRADPVGEDYFLNVHGKGLLEHGYTNLTVGSDYISHFPGVWLSDEKDGKIEKFYSPGVYQIRISAEKDGEVENFYVKMTDEQLYSAILEGSRVNKGQVRFLARLTPDHIPQSYEDKPISFKPVTQRDEVRVVTQKEGLYALGFSPQGGPIQGPMHGVYILSEAELMNFVQQAVPGGSEVQPSASQRAAEEREVKAERSGKRSADVVIASPAPEPARQEAPAEPPVAASASAAAPDVVKPRPPLSANRLKPRAERNVIPATASGAGAVGPLPSGKPPLHPPTRRNLSPEELASRVSDTPTQTPPSVQAQRELKERAVPSSSPAKAAEPSKAPSPLFSMVGFPIKSSYLLEFPKEVLSWLADNKKISEQDQKDKRFTGVEDMSYDDKTGEITVMLKRWSIVLPSIPVKLTITEFGQLFDALFKP